MSGNRRNANWREVWPVHAGSLALFLVLLLVAAGAQHLYVFRPIATIASDEEEASPGQDMAKIEAEARKAQKSVTAIAPRGIYVVVDTHANRLYVKRGETTLLEAICSTGSGELLKDPATDRQWVFDTPRGAFRVLRKVRDPVWTKPDWAFIEEGKEVPVSWSERRDPDSLGDYALHFGNGYMIHGTLYQRYLGQPITHGCIRLGDDDLERVYGLVPVGAQILIF